MPSVRPLRVGLTGGIGTGKSSALAAFRACGDAVVSLDELAHAFSRKGEVLHRAVVRVFGKRFLDKRGELDRRALGRAVFARPALRRRLERATHPFLLREMRRWMRSARRPVVVADVPLLFEAGAAKDFDVTVLVESPKEASLRRVMRRGGLGLEDARRRMRAQMPTREKARLADVVIRNRGSLGRLNETVREYSKAFNLIARGARRREP